MLIKENTEASSQKDLDHRGCGLKQPKYKKDSDDQLVIKMEFESREEGFERKKNLSAEECLNIFRKITDKDCELLGKVTSYFRV